MTCHEENLFDSSVIFTYTRAQAITDGVLVDVSEPARKAGFRVPVAVSRSVWDDCVAWTEEDDDNQTCQHESGRLWDVLWMTLFACKCHLSCSEVRVELLRIPRDGKSKKAKRCVLKSVVGPGDNGEPVITIMMPEED